MTTRTPHPVSDDSSLEAPSPFCRDQDEEPNPLLAQYERIYTNRLDEGAIEDEKQFRAIKHPTSFAIETAAATAAEEEQGKIKKKKQ